MTQLNAKYVSLFYPNVSAAAMCFMRAVGSNIFVTPHALYVNSKSDTNLFASIVHVNKVYFLIAVAHIAIVTWIINYEVTKIEITTTLIFANTGPILTVFSAGLFLPDQKLTWDAIVKVIIAFVGVFLIVFGKSAGDKGEIETSSAAWWDYVILASAPLMIAAGNVSMSAVRHLPPIIFNFYTNCFQIVGFGIVCLLDRSHFLPSPEDWDTKKERILFWFLYLIFNGLANYFAWEFKVKGY
jgi:drug/metabolite transporter (DMT)-like permease